MSQAVDQVRSGSCPLEACGPDLVKQVMTLLNYVLLPALLVLIQDCLDLRWNYPPEVTA